MKRTKEKMQFTVKQLSETGSFVGCLSPYNNKDDGGDVVEPGAYTKTLQENGNTVPMLWQHRTDCPIGELTLEDKADGLYCTGQLLMDLPEAQKAYLLLKHKIIKGLSIGYSTVKDQVVNGVRYLKELQLFEGSICTFPMNELAMVTAVKEGRMISASTASTLGDCHEHVKACAEHMKSATDILSALLGEEAGDSDEPATSKAAAVGDEGAKSEDASPEGNAELTEPDDFHSAVKILTDMRSLFAA